MKLRRTSNAVSRLVAAVAEGESALAKSILGIEVKVGLSWEPERIGRLPLLPPAKKVTYSDSVVVVVVVVDILKFGKLVYFVSYHNCFLLNELTSCTVHSTESRPNVIIT